MVSDSLDQDKVRLEIDLLRLQIAHAKGLWFALTTFGPYLAVAVSVFTVALAWRKQIEDRRRERDLDRAAKKSETLTHFDSTFATTIGNLGAGTESLRVSAAASLGAFMGVRYDEFRAQVAGAIAANLRITQTPVVQSLLCSALAMALRVHVTAETFEDFVLDLRGAGIAEADFDDVNLRGMKVRMDGADCSNGSFVKADLWKLQGEQMILTGAVLSGANLGQSRMNKSTAEQARFQGAKMASASFRDSKLANANFRACSLQSAHFDGADLRGASFSSAVLTDTYFYGALLDDGVLDTILQATGWRSAHFDASARAILNAKATTP